LATANSARRLNSNPEHGTELLIFQRPRLDQVMGNRDWRRQPYPVHGFAGDYRPRHAPFEPAHLRQFIGINLGFTAHGLRKTSDHQRRWKWPRLRCVVGNLADFDRRLFHQFAPDGFLDRFARFHETGQRGEHPGRKLLTPSD